MKDPLKIIGAIFSDKMRCRRTFGRLQQKLTASFAATEPIRRKLQRAQAKTEGANKEMRDFREANSGLEIDTITVANTLAQRRLQSRKWFAIILEAILSLGAIIYFFEFTLHIKLDWLPAVFMGCVLASFLVIVAIQLRYDGNQASGDVDGPILPKYYFLLPLMLIPVLNGFIIWSHPGNPANYLLGFFLVFSFVVNVIVTGYASQYVVMQQTKEARKVIGNLQKVITKSNEDLEKVRVEMHQARMTIVNLATELRQVYEVLIARGEKPIIVIPLPYVFVLNRRVWYTDVIPIPQIQITEPTGALAEYSQFWDAATAVDIPSNHLLESPETVVSKSSSQQHVTNDGSAVNSPLQQPEAPVRENEAAQSTEAKASTTPSGIPAPDFGQVFSENEKYV